MQIVRNNYSKSRQKGNVGEDVACLFLMKHGFRIIDRNYLKPWGEIDIIAESSLELHFVEVKSIFTEIHSQFKNVIADGVSREHVTRETIRPEENMTESKRKRLEKAIKSYLIEHKISHETPFHMDLITVKIDSSSKTAIVEMFHNAI